MSVGEVLNLLYNVHGSTRMLVGGNAIVATNDQNKAQVFTFDAYGLAIGFSQAAALTNLLHSGEFTNLANGQQYLQARYIRRVEWAV